MTGKGYSEISVVKHFKVHVFCNIFYIVISFEVIFLHIVGLLYPINL